MLSRNGRLDLGLANQHRRNTPPTGGVPKKLLTIVHQDNLRFAPPAEPSVAQAPGDADPCTGEGCPSITQPEAIILKVFRRQAMVALGIAQQ